MSFIEQFVQRDQHRVYVREYAVKNGRSFLMHGFPANLHLYDRLEPSWRSALHALRSKIGTSCVGCNRLPSRFSFPRVSSEMSDPDREIKLDH
jgi:hypothetical protein